VRDRLRALARRVREGLTAALAEEHTPHEVATSFAFGTFVTALPTAGTAFVLFLAVVYLFDRASKLALAATLVVFNPPVKFAVYGASFWLGQRLLGPVPGDPIARPTLSAGLDVVVRQVVGNVLLAALLAALGYTLVRWLVRNYRRRGLVSVAA
jgi:uncharacterized protein (DUF2062 family)